MSGSSPETPETPVLIVGAGPVGLGFAADLGWRGIDCTLVEQGAGTIDHPRANIVNARTMEFCRRWGVAEKVRAAGLPPDFPHTILHVTSLAGYELSRLEPADHGGSGASPASPERQQRCNQMSFDPVIRGLAESFPTVRLIFGRRLTGFHQDANGVTADIEDTGAGTMSRIRAQWMIDCSGGASRIREALGIGLEGNNVLGRSVNIFFHSAELARVHDKGPAAMYMITGPKGVWANVVAVDGRDYWRATIQGVGAEVELTPERIQAWLDETIGVRFAYETRAAVRWTRRTVVSEQFRAGRVFLAGDSAHQLSPSGGFGMNTGMGDVDNLGWKLAAVLRGWGGPNLLDSYRAERRPVAVRNVTEAAGAFHGRNFTASPAILENTAEGAALRRETGRRIDEVVAASFRADGVVFDYRYQPSAVVMPDGTPEPPYTMTEYHPSGWPGARAPHGWLPDGRSTLDLFGHGFVLLKFDGAPDAAPLVDAAKDRGVPLAIYEIANGEIAALYGRRLALVRPDGHVAWRGDTLPADPLLLIDTVRGAAAG